jgi:hypothetical protein
MSVSVKPRIPRRRSQDSLRKMMTKTKRGFMDKPPVRKRKK